MKVEIELPQAHWLRQLVVHKVIDNWLEWLVMPRCKYMNAEMKHIYNLDRYPNFSATGSIKGMKEKFYGKNALLVRSGSYIYNVPQEIYDKAH